MRLAELNKLAAEPDFWDNPKKAGLVMQELETLKKEAADFQNFENNIRDITELASLEKSDEISSEFDQELNYLQSVLAQWEQKTFFGGPYDMLPARLTIRSGAGGVDAQDWAEMLLRMYLRYAEKSGRSAKVVEETLGGEAGIKSATLEIEGDYAYGTLKPEAGIHRLVRLSPFNANNLRQTSFASVEVLPVILEDKAVDMNPEDLRIDTYKSGGAGGQHVNTTDSAVRITHIPTGIVVTSQSERSQLQNKEEAMKTLRGKLAEQKLAAIAEQKLALRGEHKKAEWGNQIRSYVLHPYTLVKDHRTQTEARDVAAVLDGDLSEFLTTGLKFIYPV